MVIVSQVKIETDLTSSRNHNSNIVLLIFRQHCRLPVRQNQVVFRSISTTPSILTKMSSRRSARLSAASSIIKEDPNLANGATPPKAANISQKRKNVSKEAAEPIANGNNASPTTPKKKRAKAILPPVTPTPAAIGLMSVPYAAGDGDENPPAPALNRLAVPNGTNAPLISPETHRLISNKPMDQVSPSKPGNAKTTTKEMLDEALAHLIKIEPKLKPVIEKHPCHVFSPEGLAEEIDPFQALISSIISQQVSDLEWHHRIWLQFAGIDEDDRYQEQQQSPSKPSL